MLFHLHLFLHIFLLVLILPSLSFFLLMSYCPSFACRNRFARKKQNSLHLASSLALKCFLLPVDATTQNWCSSRLLSASSATSQMQHAEVWSDCWVCVLCAKWGVCWRKTEEVKDEREEEREGEKRNNRSKKILKQEHKCHEQAKVQRPNKEFSSREWKEVLHAQDRCLFCLAIWTNPYLPHYQTHTHTLFSLLPCLYLAGTPAACWYSAEKKNVLKLLEILITQSFQIKGRDLKTWIDAL